MADSGLIRFLGNGVRFSQNAAASTYAGLRVASSIATSFYLNLPTALPGSTQALTVDTAGNMAYAALGGGGTVTSVGLSLPNIFSVSGSPVSTTGTLTATLASQAANTIFAAPNGSAGGPNFRSLVSADIPQTLTSNWITDFNTQVRTSRLDQFAVPTASLNLNSQKIVGLADPTSPQEAATKSYVDAARQGLDTKDSCRVATNGNIALTGTQSIDGVTLSVGDRVLVKDQTNASENGIYVVAAGAWTRAVDADTSAKVSPSLYTFIEEGSTNADAGWTLTTNAPITLGTTALTFTQFSGAGQVTAGSGLAKSGNTLSALGTANRISVSGSGIDIASNYVGQASITTLGTIGTGVWNGTAIAIANGGTGATTAAQARNNLAVPTVVRASFTNASLTGGQLAVTHNIGNKVVTFHIYDNNDRLVLCDIVLTSANVATADLSDFGSITGNWNYVIVG
jgi:hypothetical protein